MNSAFRHSLCFVFLTIAFLNSTCFAQYEAEDPLLDLQASHIHQVHTTITYTHGEWTITPVFGSEGIQGFFFSRSVDSSDGAYAAFYCNRSGLDWQTYAYVGPSIGGAALRAETQFDLQGALRNDSYFSQQITASGFSDSDQPGTQFAQLTNGLTRALYLVDDFQDDSTFPVLFAGDEDSDGLGVFTVATLSLACPEIDTLPSSGGAISMLSIFLAEMAEDYEEKLEHLGCHDQNHSGTMRPMKSILDTLRDCFGSTTTTQWSPTNCAPYHLVSSLPLPGEVQLCLYESTCMRTKIETTTRKLCCVVVSKRTVYINQTWTKVGQCQTTNLGEPCPSTPSCQVF